MQIFTNKEKILVVSLSLSLSIITWAKSNLNAEELPIQITEQYRWNWCWAAASLSVLNRYLKYPGIDTVTPGGSTGQCVLANQSRSNTSVDCCVNPDSCNYVMPSASDIVSILEGTPYSVDATYYTRTLNASELISRIETNKRPVLAGLRMKNNSNGPKHMVVIIALYDSGSTAMLMDPGRVFDYYYQLVDLSELKNGDVPNDESHWQWYETISLDEDPVTDVKLRHSFVDRAYNFNVQGDLVAGTDFQVKENSTSHFIVEAGKKVIFKKGFTAENGSSFEAYRD